MKDHSSCNDIVSPNATEITDVSLQYFKLIGKKEKIEMFQHWAENEIWSHPFLWSRPRPDLPDQPIHPDWSDMRVWVRHSSKIPLPSSFYYVL